MSDFKKSEKNEGEKGLTIRNACGLTPVERGGSGAKAPPLAARPVAGHFSQKSH